MRLFFKSSFLNAFLIGVWLFFSSFTFKEDIAGLVKLLSQNKNISFKFSVSNFVEGAVKPEVSSGTFNRLEDAYYYKFDNEEIVVAKEGTLIIDHEEKEVLFYEGLKDQTVKNSVIDLSSVKYLDTISGKVKAQVFTDGSRKYYFPSKDESAPVLSVSFTFGANGFLKKHETEVNDDSDLKKVVIEYSDFKTGTSVSGLLGLSKFIEYKGIDNVKLKPILNGYDLRILKNKKASQLLNKPVKDL